MPSSKPDNLSTFGNFVLDIKPNTILELGCGFGKYGVITREYTDIWAHRYKDMSWETQLDTVEIWEDYITPLHKYIYDRIYNEDALQFMRNLKSVYDLIVCADLVEHFEKNEGIELLELMKAKSKYAFITIPRVVAIRGKHYGNPYESHKSKWTRVELSNYGKVEMNKVFYILIMGKK